MAVGKTKKSIDVMQLAWLCRNVRHVCDGGLGERDMYFETVAWETLTPSFNNSPWIRGAPHSGFSRLIRRMRSRTSRGTAGRPPLRRPDFQVQNTARFRPLVRRCRELGRALRIGTNHGSLSDRVMNRYDDLVESVEQVLTRPEAVDYVILEASGVADPMSLAAT